MKSKFEDRYLASLWSPPALLPNNKGAGSPVLCCASTFTFHADFFEHDLMPRFLGLRFDEMEGSVPFAIECEEALAKSRVAVMVDAACVSGDQRTLRWDQIPIFVPGACQHSKVTLLAWENCLRLIVASANITRNGYKLNREIAGALTFCNHEISAPRELATGVIDFLERMTKWARADAPVLERLHVNLRKVRKTVESWTAAPAKFGDRQQPRAAFVAGYPGIDGIKQSRVLEETRAFWGAARADEITVMTPFIGQQEADFTPLMKELLEIPRRRNAAGFLAVPRHPPTDQNDTRIKIDLPKTFLEQWSKAWRATPQVFAVPQRRKSDTRDRPLHAKGILIANDEKALLLCGSSNFSLHGMGVAVAPNIEANLVYIDDAQSKDHLAHRLPIDWDADVANDAVWSDVDVLGDDDERQGCLLPNVFQWATYNQVKGTVTFGFKEGAVFPAAWWIDIPGNTDAALTILSKSNLAGAAPGQFTCMLPAALVGAHIVALRVTWRDDKNDEKSAMLLTHALKYEDLLPHEASRGLSSETIIDCLITRKDLADIAFERDEALMHGPARPVPVHDTTNYLLYRIRRLGLALGLLGTRLLATPRSHDALFYRLLRDPLGPLSLAKALLREYEPRRTYSGESAAMLFALTEISLTVAYAGKKWNASKGADEPDLRQLFSDCLAELKTYRTAIEAYEPSIASYALKVDDQARSFLTVAGVP